MNDSQKIKDFSAKTHEKLELINLSLLKHEKNPKDREFLNDIFRSMRSIRNWALHAGFGRISELSFHVAGMIDLFCQQKLEPDDALLDIVVAVKDRIAQLVREIETSRAERGTIKDLLDRIRQLEEQISREVLPESGCRPDVAVIKEPDAERIVDWSLLPDEVKNEEYDPELFRIYLDQTQEHLSLLRSLTDSYATTPDKARVVSLCSDLVGKLQTSANYMGYERLADFYLQWVAELEMMGVEMSVGGPVSFAFMDGKIKQIAALFPQIKDIPSTSPLPEKTMSDEAGTGIGTEPAEDEADSERLKDLFSSMEVERPPFDENSGPVAALSDDEPEGSAPSSEHIRPKETRLSRKFPAPAAPFDIDASFLDEERRSNDFDQELFQIFVQQLRENLSQLRSLTETYPKTRNKSRVIDQCSDLVSKLQASANYMGYDQLAEYYLQWIAELEMAGVDISLGKKVSLAFMDEKIGKVADLFADVEDVPAPPYQTTEQTGETPVGPADEPAVDNLDEAELSASLSFLFGELEEEEVDAFDVDEGSISALADQEPSEDEEHPPPAAEESPAGRQVPGEKKPDEDLYSLFRDTEETQTVPPGEDRHPAVPPLAADQSRGALLRKLSEALKSLEKEPAAGDAEISIPEMTPPGAELDSGLYARLLDALESTAVDDIPDPASPSDQVMEEIMTLASPAQDQAGPRTGPEPARSGMHDTGEKDTLMNNVSKLVVGRSSLARLYSEMTGFHHALRSGESFDAIKLRPLKKLIVPLNDAGLPADSVSNEITAGLLQIRMIPAGHLFKLYQEIVDRQAGAGRQIRLDVTGEETEIDQGMIDDIAQCLLPIVSNAVIHGIEPPSDRKLAGKDPIGAVRLAAYYDCHNLVVEVADDGRGIDPGRIKAVALARKMFTGDELYRMSDDELTSMIMSPGFTTVDDASATDRGDGMDSVRAIIDRLNGSVRIKSTVGKGTVIGLRIPLRTPLFKALKFTIGTGHFAVPLTCVEEILRQDAGQIMHEAEGERLLFRGKAIPVLSPARLNDTESTGKRGEKVYIVIVSSGRRKAGLLVDSVIGLEEVVIKPLADYLRQESGPGRTAAREEDDIFLLPDIDGMMRSTQKKPCSVKNRTSDLPG